MALLDSVRRAEAGAESVNAVSTRIHSAWAEVPAHWHAIAETCPATPFQAPHVIAAWYATFGAREGVAPVFVEIVAADGSPAALVPMAVGREGPLRVATFADAGVVDFACPIPGPGFGTLTPEVAWRALRDALAGVDLVRLEKQPARIGVHVNPFAHVAGATRSPLSSHPLTVSGPWEDYVRSRSRKFRKEQGRVWRVFERNEGAAFRLAADAPDGLSALDVIEELQGARLRSLGVAYRLGDPLARAFYRRLVADGVPRGRTVIGMLVADDLVVGALMGLAAGQSVVFVRLAHRGGSWAACSPGRLVIEKTMEALHARGFTSFDFSIGDYGYKSAFGVGTSPLSDLSAAVSWRGMPFALAAAVKARLRRVLRRDRSAGERRVDEA